MARPKKYATAAERQKAFRERQAHVIIQGRVTPDTADTIKRLAEIFDVPQTEVINSLIIYALLNRNWHTLGLFGKRLPYQKNPNEGGMT